MNKIKYLCSVLFLQVGISFVFSFYQILVFFLQYFVFFLKQQQRVTYEGLILSEACPPWVRGNPKSVLASKHYISVSQFKSAWRATTNVVGGEPHTSQAARQHFLNKPHPQRLVVVVKLVEFIVEFIPFVGELGIVIHQLLIEPRQLNAEFLQLGQNVCVTANHDAARHNADVNFT